MSINTELIIFCQHFAKNLKEKSKLQVESDNITVEIELTIGEGLLMTCSFEVDSTIKLNETPHDYKIIMKMFMKQLFEAK